MRASGQRRLPLAAEGHGALLAALRTAVLALGGGLLLRFALSFLDRAVLDLVDSLLPPAWRGATGLPGLIATVLVEEGGKAVLLLALLGTIGRVPGGAAPALGTGLVAIVTFSALENLAYLAASPGSDVFLRLLVSSPVHLVSGLALAIGFAPAHAGEGPGRGPGTGGPAARGGRGRDAARAGAALAFALAWHLGANILASSAIGNRGPVPVMVAASNLAALALLARAYLFRVILAGQAAWDPGRTRGGVLGNTNQDRGGPDGRI